MSYRPDQQHSHTLPIALTGAVGILGTAMIATALSSPSSSKAPEQKAQTILSVNNFKEQLEGMGIAIKQIPVMPGATAIGLINSVNIKEGEKVLNDEGQHTTTSIVHLGDIAVQRLAQLPAGEGNGQKSELGPDGVQEYDLNPATPGQAPVLVDVPVITDQHTADILNNGGALPVIE